MLTIYGNSYIKLNSSTTTQANVINSWQFMGFWAKISQNITIEKMIYNLFTVKPTHMCNISLER